jgi:L-asparaginase / beta-aspartyl-peptidase
MNKIAIVVHGGAKPYSPDMEEKKGAYEKGVQDAINAGYAVLESGGTALEAVHEAVKVLEDNEHFNAGRGSELNERGEIQMDASIMDGSNLASGAVAMISYVKNPISLAKAVMEKSKHLFMGDRGAASFAREMNLEFQPLSYFITEEQQDAFYQKGFRREK